MCKCDVDEAEEFHNKEVEVAYWKARDFYLNGLPESEANRIIKEQGIHMILGKIRRYLFSWKVKNVLFI